MQRAVAVGYCYCYGHLAAVIEEQGRHCMLVVGSGCDGGYHFGCDKTIAVGY